VAINRAINNTMSINGKNYYFFLYIKTEFVHKFSLYELNKHLDVGN